MDSSGGSLELVRRAQGGELGALDLLFARYYERVRKVVRLRMGLGLRRDLESDDILQETFLAAVEDFDRFEIESDASLIQWLARLAENRMRDAAKHRGALKRDRRREIALEHVRASQSLAPSTIALADSAALPFDVVADAERAERFERCVASLDEEARELVLLRHYIGADWKTITEDRRYRTERAARVAHAKALFELGRRLRDEGLLD
jgi:RNA polymerase sigma factor (sigma-70 family)